MEESKQSQLHTAPKKDMPRRAEEQKLEVKR